MVVLSPVATCSASGWVAVADPLSWIRFTEPGFSGSACFTLRAVVLLVSELDFSFGLAPLSFWFKGASLLGRWGVISFGFAASGFED